MPRLLRDTEHPCVGTNRRAGRYLCNAQLSRSLLTTGKSGGPYTGKAEKGLQDYRTAGRSVSWQPRSSISFHVLD